MWNDPQEPEYVRELLQTGREFRVDDYDYSRGLKEHLEQVAAGAPVPEWAQAGSVAGAAGGSLLPWLSVPVLLGAAVAVGVFMNAGAEDGPQAPQAVAPAAARVVLEQVNPYEPPGALHEPDEGPTQGTEPTDEPRRLDQGTARTVEAQGEAADRHDPPPATPSADLQRPARKRAPKTGAGARVQRPPVAEGTHAKGLGPDRDIAKGPAVAQGERAEPSRTRHAAGAAALTESSTPEPTGVPQAPAEVAAGGPEPTNLHEVWSRGAMREDLEDQAAEDRLEREMRMLSVAQRVLMRDPGRALRLARQGEREFRGSMFTAERKQVLLLALVQLGRLAEARRLAAPYLEKYPKGPFSERIRRALETGRVTP